jgi:DNA invertase Pin-like site-specific DNA recombinase
MSPAKKSPPVFAYVRWSSDQQESGDSLRRQTDLAADYAKRNSLDLPPENVIVDRGLSAWSGENVAKGELGKLLANARTGKLPKGAIILVEELDRFSRQGINASHDIIQTFIKAGVEVRTINDSMVYNSQTYGLIQHIMSGVKSHLAKDEQDKKSKRCKEGWATLRNNAASKPVTARCPAWLELKDGKFHIVKERAKVLHHIFEQNVSGIGAFRITRDLNANKVPTFRCSRLA